MAGHAQEAGGYLEPEFIHHQHLQVGAGLEMEYEWPLLPQCWANGKVLNKHVT